MELWNCLILICLLWSSHFNDEQFSFARGVGLVIGVRAHRTCTRAQSDRVNWAPFNFHTSDKPDKASFSSELEWLWGRVLCSFVKCCRCKVVPGLGGFAFDTVRKRMSFGCNGCDRVHRWDFTLPVVARSCWKWVDILVYLLTLRRKDL